MYTNPSVSLFYFFFFLVIYIDFSKQNAKRYSLNVDDTSLFRDHQENSLSTFPGLYPKIMAFLGIPQLARSVGKPVMGAFSWINPRNGITPIDVD